VRGNHHIHRRNEIGDSSRGFSLPDRDCALAAYKYLSCIVIVDAIEWTCFVEEQTLPEDAVVDYEHARVEMHVVHVNEVGHYIDELPVH
jgi:hypothetical protein